MVHNRCNCYFSFWASFCPFTAHNSPKNINFKKIKKPLEILSFYTSVQKIISYTVPEIWDARDVIAVFRYGQFLSFYPASSPKSENFKTMKKAPGDIIILHKCTKNHDHMLYCPWDMAHGTCNCCFSFWQFFSLLPPKSPKKQNFKKMKKSPADIIILHTCTKNYD